MTSPAAAVRRGDDRELVALARGGGLNFIGAAVTQVGTMVVLLLITRNLSKTDVGLFRQSFKLFSLLQVVALLGLGQALTRYVAVFRRSRSWRRRGHRALGHGDRQCVRHRGRRHPLRAERLDRYRDLRQPGAGDAPAVRRLRSAPAAITMAALAACSGFRTMRPNAFLGLMLDPALRVVLNGIAIGTGAGLTGVLQAFVVVPYITAVLALIWLVVLPRGPHVKPRFASREIMHFKSLAWLATFTTQGLLWVDQLILPLYVSPSSPSTAWRRASSCWPRSP